MEQDFVIGSQTSFREQGHTTTADFANIRFSILLKSARWSITAERKYVLCLLVDHCPGIKKPNEKSVKIGNP